MMNARILRMCDRSAIRSMRSDRHVRGLGQLQPVLFSIESKRGITLRIEGMSGARWCWWALPVATHKTQAKAAFAELEQCKRLGIDSPARAAWREHERRQAAKVLAPDARAKLQTIRRDLFSDYELAHNKTASEQGGSSV